MNAKLLVALVFCCFSIPAATAQGGNPPLTDSTTTVLERYMSAYQEYLRARINHEPEVATKRKHYDLAYENYLQLLRNTGKKPTDHPEGTIASSTPAMVAPAIIETPPAPKELSREAITNSMSPATSAQSAPAIVTTFETPATSSSFSVPVHNPIVTGTITGTVSASPDVSATSGAHLNTLISPESASVNFSEDGSRDSPFMEPTEVSEDQFMDFSESPDDQGPTKP